MPLVKSKKILNLAMKKRYAVGHFNVDNLETVQAVVLAAEEKRAPVMLAVSESELKYAGFDNLVSIIKLAAKNARIPVMLHLDHGKDMKTIRRCIDSGFSSVMIDASFYDFEKNVEITKRVVRMAKKRRVPVEAELGSVDPGKDRKGDDRFTDPHEAREFARLTGIDSLAISIGTSHGAYKFASKPKIDLKRLQLIDDVVDIPLVLHGASEVPAEYVKLGMKHGAKWKGAKGLDNRHLSLACSMGIDKVNIHTDLNIIRIASTRQYLDRNPGETDPRKIQDFARSNVREFVKKKLDILGSSGKA